MALFVKAEVMNIKLQMILIPKIIFYPEVMEAIQSEAVIWGILPNWFARRSSQIQGMDLQAA